MYNYVAIISRVIDGDTIVADIDLGLGIWKKKERLRLARINSPENNTPAGQAATAFLKSLIETKTVAIHTIKDKHDKYGRYLVEIEFRGSIINDTMVVMGYASYA